MSDTNLQTNSYIELTEIRKLDNLLTQCESKSCENICIDCCANIGSLENVLKYSDYTTPHSCSTNADESYFCYDFTATTAAAAAAPIVPIVSVTNPMDFVVVNNNNNNNNATTNSLQQKNAANEIFAAITTATKLNPAAVMQKQKSLNNDKTTTNCCRYCKQNASQKEHFSKQRFFSLDKERSEKFNNKFEKKNVVGGSENTLMMKNRNKIKDSTACSSTSSSAYNPSATNRKQLSIIKTSVIACENCDIHSNHIIPSLSRLKTSASAPTKDNMNRMISRKSSLSKDNNLQLVIDMNSSGIEKDSSVTVRESLRTAFSPQNLAKKISVKRQSINTTEQLLLPDIETLLQAEKLYLHEKKIPEPVETVGIFSFNCTCFLFWFIDEVLKA